MKGQDPKRTSLRAALAVTVLAALAIAAGAALEGSSAVWYHAANVCYECIGVG